MQLPTCAPDHVQFSLSVSATDRNSKNATNGFVDFGPGLVAMDALARLGAGVGGVPWGQSWASAGGRAVDRVQLASAQWQWWPQ
jgi:hypothetical protein